MQNEVRTICFDAELNIEAYSFKGIMQKFPNHFHEYYVIGFIESGQRHLSCKNREYNIEPGDLTLFNPGDNHTCEQIDSRALDYCCINIQQEIMRKAVFEITGKDYLPYFKEPVLFHSDLVSTLRELHFMVMSNEKDFKKEEIFLFIIQQLISEHADTVSSAASQEINAEIYAVCEYLEENYMKNIKLNELSDLAGLNKYYLIRSFTKQKGISPYSYLETIRISKAKKLLEQGASLIDVAFQTGFADQSHFTNFFKKLIGLTPKQYKNIFIK
ncbi:AraC family transcriptional regulator [Clostridium sp. PL3]|uniref:AraC family transcriptional regulator n=1 Tax=Clostridium thailandense TaxID=2794346 RepID=A0A949U3Y7_9CLOT|nr:AraC family transcriptional regulator [Clostridium thailandense]MBV7276013.1 AraC family transcriptional regulator [Clostridium thailandense]